MLKLAFSDFEACAGILFHKYKLFIKVFPYGLMDDMASKNISNYTVSYTALPMETDLHNQALVVQLQKYTKYFPSSLSVSPKIVQNVVALTHFFSTRATRWKHI